MVALYTILASIIVTAIESTNNEASSKLDGIKFYRGLPQLETL